MAHHGNTPAAWTAVTVAMVGFVVGGVALMLDPVSMPLFWVGCALGVASLRRLRRDGEDGHERLAGNHRCPSGEPAPRARTPWRRLVPG